MMPGIKTANNQRNRAVSDIRPTLPGITNPRKQFVALSPGRAGVFEVVETMAACVRGEVAPDFIGKDSPVIRAAGQEIEALFFGQTFPESVFAYCQNCIEYRQHPIDLQVIQDARQTMLLGYGDCVSLSILVATLLASRDWPCWFILQDPLGQEYTHVYCETLINGKFVALDPVGKYPMGWRQELPEVGFETTWPIFRK